jgi:hypothetical protein
MKKFLHCRNSACKGAAPIAVLALVVLATSYNAERAMAASDTCQFIASAAIASPGNFYKVGDNLDPVAGTLCGLADNYGFRLQVSSVDANGGVTAVTIAPGGIGYSNPPSNPIVFAGSATGSGFTANCTFN